MVVCDGIGYLVAAGIPMLAFEWDETSAYRSERDRRSELLFGAFLLIRKSFPCFSFHPYPTATMYFRNADVATAMQEAIAVVNGEHELPCLYDPYSGNGRQSDPDAYIQRLRSSEAYIDLFHSPQIPFSDLIALLRPRYRINDHDFRPTFVAGVFDRLDAGSRFVQIAIHYFVRAARLICEHFIEEAGLNLNLVVEAIAQDVANVHGIKDKKRAIKTLQETLSLPYDHMGFLGELYSARNEFLAHIDKDMFTDEEKINDPDRYCYEHFESVSWLIRRYIKHRSAERANLATTGPVGPLP